MKTTKFPGINIRIKSVNILLAIFAVIFLISCKNEDELFLEKTILQGSWVEVEPEGLVQLAGENHTFIFNEDSFFLKIDPWTDVVYPDDTCSTCPDFIYVKGEYSFDLNTISLEGKQGLLSDFTEPEDNRKILIYQVTYNYELKSSNTLILNPESEYESITLVKD